MTVENILLNLSSGMPVENLSEQEIKFLEIEYGKNWRLILGFSTESKERKPNNS